jgi:hypothetical protein
MSNLVQEKGSDVLDSQDRLRFETLVLPRLDAAFHTIAALVYGRHKHEISVFIWPIAENDAAPRSGTQQGHQWISWREDGMEFYAVSDIAATDLAELQQLFSQF